MRTQSTSERVAQNQARFRQANEGIERTAEELTPELARVPFICECPDRRCTTIVRLSLAEYETVRSRGSWFLVARGHEITTQDGDEFARVARVTEAYTVMEKIGEAGELADSLDPRG